MTKAASSVICLAFLFLGLPPTSRAQLIAGDWKGNVTPELSVVLHVAANGKTYSATADSPKQNAFGIPATFTVDGNKLSFTIAFAGKPASFNGVRNDDSISGTFRQGGVTTPLTIVRSSPPTKSSAPAPSGNTSATGDWRGPLTADLLVVLHVTANGTGYSATGDSPNQNSYGMAVTFTVDGDDVSFTVAVPDNPATFTGKRNGNTISGTFHQGEDSVPLTLTRKP